MANQLPKHINHVLKDRKAVAPYNFVELPDKIVEAEPSLPDGDRYHDHKENPSHPNEIKRYSGRVKCTLTPESQIYIRCGWNPEDYAKYSESSFKDLCEVLKQTRANFFHHPADLSPIKQQQQNNNNNVRMRQSSLSELDEINYNNRQTLEQQQHQQQELPINNQFEDLYGKVRNNNNNNNNFVHHQQQIQHHHQQQQFKTLPSRNGNINNTSLNVHSNGNFNLRFKNFPSEF